MQIHILETKGRALTRCDQCGGSNKVSECFLPYNRTSATSRHWDGRYRDLCRGCFDAISAHPDRYVRADTDLSGSGFRRRGRAYPWGVTERR